MNVLVKSNKKNKYKIQNSRKKTTCSFVRSEYFALFRYIEINKHTKLKCNNHTQLSDHHLHFPYPPLFLMLMIAPLSNGEMVVAALCEATNLLPACCMPHAAV